MRTLNGEILIDDEGNLNEGLWLNNLIQLYDTFGKKDSEESEEDEDNVNPCTTNLNRRK